MFCPEGYVLLSEIVAELWAKSGEWYNDEMRAKMLPEIEAEQEHFRQLRIQFETEKPHLEGDSAVRNHPIFKARRPTTETPRDAYYEWLVQGLLVGKSEKFVASSPDGKIVRLGAGVFETYQIYDGPFPDTLKEQLSLYHHLFMGYFHLDTFYGTILPCADPDIIHKNGLVMSTRLIKPLAGWSICWKPKVFENWQQELREMLAEPTSTQDMPSAIMRRRGRPKKGDGVVERAVQIEFSKRKREGRLQLDQLESIWLEVEVWAQEVLGEYVPRSSAQRFLAEILKE